MRLRAAQSKKSGRLFRLVRRILLPCITIALTLALGVYFTQKSIFWQQKWLRTVVITTPNTILVASIPADVQEKILVFTLPEDVYVQVPYGYGQYRLEAVRRLGEIEKRPELLAETVEDLLGVRVTGQIGSREAEGQAEREADARVSELISPLAVFTRKLKSTLNWASTLHLSLKFTFSRPDSITYVTVHDPQLFTEAELPDTSKVKYAVLGAIDEVIEQKFIDLEVRTDGLRLEIKNTSGVSDVGQNFSRFVTNIGGTVIGVGNEIATLEGCHIRVGHVHAAKKIIRFLREEFGCTTANHLESDRADAVILLGRAFGLRWQQTIDQ